MPVVGSFGGRDRTLRGAADKLDQALAANGVARDIKEYPDAGHSFLNDHQNVWFTLVGKMMGGAATTRRPQPTRVRRIIAFFDRELR